MTQTRCIFALMVLAAVVFGAHLLFDSPVRAQFRDLSPSNLNSPASTEQQKLPQSTQFHARAMRQRESVDFLLSGPLFVRQVWIGDLDVPVWPEP